MMTLVWIWLGFNVLFVLWRSAVAASRPDESHRAYARAEG